ncbi:acylphosphatase [Histidinibacterium aquaticum]|uniref:acylphosphatase n=1 Tax=Histidinibacterium aquaticum TaxID=2613962 RepID=A0A5J5GA54_9RHOB|nr:acylphosphatase [Histidinibacterium aquaticum]KAA9004773.1 acylphosphatase [Histidinibacterium aquaticum]
MKAMDIRIDGRVQGVSFRAWAQQEAQSLGLRGWIRNHPDMSVVAYIEGDDEAVDKMLDRMNSGPPAARVNRVRTAPAEPIGMEDFEIRA